MTSPRERLIEAGYRATSMSSFDGRSRSNFAAGLDALDPADLLDWLIERGALEPIMVDNDDGAGGLFISEDGERRSFSRPSTKRIVGYRVAPPLSPGSEKGAEHVDRR